MKFTTSHSERPFPIHIVSINYHAPDCANQIATVIVTEDDFAIGDNKTAPSIAYEKLCKAKGVNKGSLIVDGYIVDSKITQIFVI